MLSRKQLKLVHVAARAVGMDEARYREFLRAQFGVESSKRLQQKEFEKFMREMKRRGFRALRRDGSELDDPTPPGMMTNQQRWEIARLLDALGLTTDSRYFCQVMRKASGCDRVAWLTKISAGKTIDALRDIVRRGGVKALAGEAP